MESGFVYVMICFVGLIFVILISLKLYSMIYPKSKPVDNDKINIKDIVKNIDSVEDVLELGDIVTDSFVDEYESKKRENEYNQLTMSSEFINEMIDIEGEPIIYRFEEATNTAKEIISGGSIYLSFICMGLFAGYNLACGYLGPIDALNRFSFSSIFIFALVVFGIIPFLYELIKRANSKRTKHHYSWAISENYFIQVLDGMVDIGFDKKDIWHIENTGYEIILSLNCNNPLAINDDGTEPDIWDKQKLVMEDVINIDEAYKVLKEWIGQEKD